MSKNNNQFVPFSPFDIMNQSKGNATASFPMFQLPNFQAMNQMASQALLQKFNQMQAYACQMAKTGATMLSQLYMEHAAMVQQTAFLFP